MGGPNLGGNFFFPRLFQNTQWQQTGMGNPYAPASTGYMPSNQTTATVNPSAVSPPYNVYASWGMNSPAQQPSPYFPQPNSPSPGQTPAQLDAQRAAMLNGGMQMPGMMPASYPPVSQAPALSDPNSVNWSRYLP